MTIRQETSRRERIYRSLKTGFLRLVSLGLIPHTVAKITKRLVLSTLTAAKMPDEKDFLALKILPIEPDALIIDVGANIGQSALGLSTILPGCKVVSFEANPELVGELEWVKRKLGERFEFHSCALGSRKEVILLHVPQVGRYQLSARASGLRRQSNQLGHQNPERGSLARAIEVNVQTLDSFGLAPHIIKIDVEGMELDVLRGAKQTITENLPLIIFERNSRIQACMSMLEPLGYTFHQCEHVEGPTLRPYINKTNAFAIPVSMRS